MLNEALDALSAQTVALRGIQPTGWKLRWHGLLTVVLTLAIVVLAATHPEMAKGIEALKARLERPKVYVSRTLAHVQRTLGIGQETTTRPEVQSHETSHAPRQSLSPVPAPFTACKPGTVQLGEMWIAPQTFEYFAAWPRGWTTALVGLHQTGAKKEVKIKLKTTCRKETCQICVQSVIGRMGYRPSRISVRADLHSKPCVRHQVLLHEQRHTAVTRDAEQLALSSAREQLGWVSQEHRGYVVPRERNEEGKTRVFARIEDDLRRAMSQANQAGRRPLCQHD